MVVIMTWPAKAELKTLPGHVPKLPAGLVAKGMLPGTNQLRLAIGLPLRNQAALNELLAQLYDPRSTNFQHYLTPEEFAARFGPTTNDYAAVMAFARSNHLTLAGTHGNRLLLDVLGRVEDVQRAFHVTLRTYRHPTENRDFYAPEGEPSVEGGLAVTDISGLNNYVRPRPHSQVRAATSHGTGSGVSGTFLGNDFRAAYLPGVTLTGVGQTVGLVQFDGFDISDIQAYAADAGLAMVPVQTVLLDGYDGTPYDITGGSMEVSLDIEMVMSMAPGVSNIMVFEGGPNGVANDILNAIATSDQVKQISCSWGWPGGPSTTTDAILTQMAAQGQSFFVASGDSDAFTTGANSANGVDNPSLAGCPASSPYVTAVGGTTLTTAGAGGAWSSETVWNWGYSARAGQYVGSSGGISSYYGIPDWQSNVDMSVNGGSSTNRNVPDVALTADNVFVTYGGGSSGTVGGTSCAAPLWAGMTALINQQAVASGGTSVGFLNPAIYALGVSAAYTNVFHDTRTGNNFSSNSPGSFAATNGFDLCTGWGTPAGLALIQALSGVTNWLGVRPGSGFAANGPVGGAFDAVSRTLTLTNLGSTSLAWSLVNTSAWLSVSITNGTLAGGGVATVAANLTAAAAGLAPGTYDGSLLVTNPGAGILVPFWLSISQSVLQNGGFEMGNFSAWTLLGNTVSGGLIYNAVEGPSSGFAVANSGTYGAFLGDIQMASLSQSFGTVAGQYYLLSFWVVNPSSGSGQNLVVNWISGGITNTLLSWPSPGVFAWTNLQYLVAATGTNATVMFGAENDTSYFGLDDVSVTPVPSPGFTTLAPSGSDLQLSWLASTGLVYQVQYKTNLWQTNWNNLNAAFAATNYSAGWVDTNALAAPARFYRLGVGQ